MATNEKQPEDNNETTMISKITEIPRHIKTTNAVEIHTTDNQYFFEDEVFRIDKKGHVKFGMVTETCDSYDEEDYDEAVGKGEVRVSWYPSGKEELLQERAIGLVDRTLMPGDVVRRLVPGRNTQRGYVREVKVSADVRILNSNYVIKDVVTERLKSVISCPREAVVCLDSWVGSTRVSEDRVIMRTTYGARIEVPSQVFWAFEDYDARNLHGIYDPVIMFPGNTLIGRLPSLDYVTLLTPDIPLKKNRKGKPLTERYIVESVCTDSAWVHWQCKALSRDKDELEQPDPIVTGDDLKRLQYLNLFEACMLQIGDRNFLTYEENDQLVKRSTWENEQAAKYKLIYEQQQTDEHQSLFVNASGATSISSSSHHTHESLKLKKKLALLDTEKTVSKFKKFFSSVAVSNSKKESSAATIKNAHDLHTKQSNESCNDNNSWFTEDEDEDVDGDDENDNEDIIDVDMENEDEMPSEASTLANGKESDASSLGGVHSSGSGSSNTGSVISKSFPVKYRVGLHRQLAVRRNFIKNNLKKLRKSSSYKAPKYSLNKLNVGDNLHTETLLVYSKCTVVWQDGTIEVDINSTDLYPIHHLDNHEFFPGDFVINEDEDSDESDRDYGVIQNVDHLGRTSLVKWFTTYLSNEQAKPTYKGEKEVSVYNLKDHPDFQYRPGVMVIRVANFEGEDVNCTAGQVMDNLPCGQVKVWWVDGHVSMCWPQDLFEVGEHVSNDWGNESEDSWETQSTHTNCSQKVVEHSHILLNIERARVAIERLGEIFHLSPTLQNIDVMRKLLSVYKCCRYLDRLLNTNFFHEDNFMGLIERVRKCQTISECAQDRKNRLFNESTPIKLSVLHNSLKPACAANGSHESVSPTKVVEVYIVDNAVNSSLSTSTNTSGSTPQKCHVHSDNSEENICSPTKNAYNAERNHLLSTAILNIERAFEKTTLLKALGNVVVTTMNDSGNYSGKENCDISTLDSTNSNDTSNTAITTTTNQDSGAHSGDLKSVSSLNMEITNETNSDDKATVLMCARLCALLKDQLRKCIDEIREKYYQDDSIQYISDVEIEEYFAECSQNSVDLKKTINDNVEETTQSTVCVQVNMNAEDIENDEQKDATKNGTTSSPTIVIDSAHALNTLTDCTEYFQLVPSSPKEHKFQLTIFQPNNAQQFHKAVQREHRMLRSALPPGVWVRVFEDRMDLLSVMMEGPKNTPYEDGLFLFDLQLSRNYPKSPPQCHYISYCSDRLNPNLYEDGKVCVSLLGTWTGRDTEMWGANSTLLQLIVSIQGLILVPEPYFNEAGYEKQKGTQQGEENSRMYNEMAIIKMVQATTKLLQQPPPLFNYEILDFYQQHGMLLYERVKGWTELSKIHLNKDAVAQESAKMNNVCWELPEFPLIPASRGFCLTLAGLLDTFKAKLCKFTQNWEDAKAKASELILTEANATVSDDK